MRGPQANHQQVREVDEYEDDVGSTRIDYTLENEESCAHRIPSKFPEEAVGLGPASLEGTLQSDLEIPFAASREALTVTCEDSNATIG